MEKRTITIIETHQVRLIKKLEPEVEAWCDGCAASVPTVSPETASLRAQVVVRAVYRWVEAGAVHFLETADGRLMICLASLRQLTARDIADLTPGPTPPLELSPQAPEQQ